MSNPHSILLGIGLMIFLVSGWLIYESRNYVTHESVSGVSVCEEYVLQTGEDIAAIIAAYYEPLYPISINGVALNASIAQTPVERQRGLSNTPCLPRDIAKLFVFDSNNYWGFWMKDMNYAIDIIWVDEKGRVVDWVETVEPSTYPVSFSPRVPARYVIETVPGFVSTHAISTSSVVVLPEYR